MVNMALHRNTVETCKSEQVTYTSRILIFL